MMPGRDSRTRHPGIFARHQERCRFSQDPGAEPQACNCKPSYYGIVHDQSTGKKVRTARYRKISEARTARDDLAARVRAGTIARHESNMTLDTAIEQFVEAARDGIALNKKGRRYKPRSVDALESALNQVDEKLRRRKLGGLTRGDIQRIADDLARAGKAGSTVRSTINALRSLFHWALDREYVGANPAELVRLPAMDEKPRDRVATPAEFADLLSRLKLRDQAAYAIAGYAGGRHHEIQMLDWSLVSFELDAIELGSDETAQKSKAAHRVVPMVKPLRSILRRHWLAEGRPTHGKVCAPRKGSKSGKLDLSYVQRQVRENVWIPAGVEPIGLHESRHTFGTWLDHAKISPKINSALMGHTTVKAQAGAAQITLNRYTHVLPGELIRARDDLDAFLTARTKAERAANE